MRSNKSTPLPGARLVGEFSTETILALSRDRMIAVHPTFLVPEIVRIGDLQTATASS